MKALNLLPDSYLQHRRRAKLVRTAASGAVTALLVAVGWAGLAAYQSKQLHALADTLRREVDAEVAQNQSLRAKADEQRLLRTTLALQGHVQLAAPASILLRALPDLLPESCALLSLNLVVPPPVAAAARAGDEAGTRKTAVKPSPNLELVGLAPSEVDVAQAVRSLSASPLVRNVKLESSRRVLVAGRECYQFKLQCKAQFEKPVKVSVSEEASCR